MKTCSFLFLVYMPALVYGTDEAINPTTASVDDVAQAAEQDYSMFDLMEFVYQPDEPVTTEEEAFNNSSLIVRGYIDSITEGRSVIDTETRTRTPQNTALIKIEVSEAIKGAAGKYVYFEYMRGGLPAEALDSAKYMGEVLLYLRDAFDYPDTFEVVNSSRGLMHEVEKLYLLTSTSLFFTQNDKLGAGILKRNSVEAIQNDNPGADPDPDSIEREQFETE